MPDDCLPWYAVASYYLCIGKPAVARRYFTSVLPSLLSPIT